MMLSILQDNKGRTPVVFCESTIQSYYYYSPNTISICIGVRVEFQVRMMFVKYVLVFFIFVLFHRHLFWGRRDSSTKSLASMFPFDTSHCRARFFSSFFSELSLLHFQWQQLSSYLKDGPHSVLCIQKKSDCTFKIQHFATLFYSCLGFWLNVSRFWCQTLAPHWPAPHSQGHPTSFDFGSHC